MKQPSAGGIATHARVFVRSRRSYSSYSRGVLGLKFERATAAPDGRDVKQAFTTGSMTRRSET